MSLAQKYSAKMKSAPTALSVGLYRDDRLGIIHNSNGPKLDRLRKMDCYIQKTKG